MTHLRGQSEFLLVKSNINMRLTNIAPLNQLQNWITSKFHTGLQVSSIHEKFMGPGEILRFLFNFETVSEIGL
jgi:hypothetical protein